MRPQQLCHLPVLSIKALLRSSSVSLQNCEPVGGSRANICVRQLTGGAQRRGGMEREREGGRWRGTVPCHRVRAQSQPRRSRPPSRGSQTPSFEPRAGRSGRPRASCFPRPRAPSCARAPPPPPPSRALLPAREHSHHPTHTIAPAPVTRTSRHHRLMRTADTCQQAQRRGGIDRACETAGHRTQKTKQTTRRENTGRRQHTASREAGDRAVKDIERRKAILRQPCSLDSLAPVV